MRSRALLLGLSLLGWPSARAEVLERTLAVVGDRPVMLTEVTAVARLRGLGEKEGVDATIDERLMFQEAARLPQASVSAEEEEQAYRSLLPRWPAAAGPPPETDLRRLARRETAILKYVAFRFRPQVRVTDDAVRTAYDAEYGGRAEAPPYDAVADTIRERIAGRDLDQRIEAWVRELRSAAEIRYNP